jgi:cellulose synthase operon protein B
MSIPMPLARLGVFAGLGLCLLAGSAQAARIAVPFARTDLNGGAASTTAPIVLPATIAIRRAQLVVAYANALAVDPARSGLLVGLNDELLVELPLVATQGTISADIAIPVYLLEAGANVLSFRARQQHRVGCDRAALTELWTRLDPEASHLQLDVAPRPGTITLRDLEGLLASSLYNGEAFTIATGRALDDALLEWGGIAAEAVALRRGRRPLVIRHAQLAARRGPEWAGAVAWSALRGQNFAVIGTFAEIGETLPQTLPEEAGEGLIAVRPLPADPAHFAVIVSGSTEAAVGRAVAAFRSPGEPWPDTPAMAVPVGAAPPPAGPAAAPAITGGRPLTLAALGYTTEDLPLSFTEALEVGIDFPEDYYAGNGQQIELALDYAYGAGLAPTSALIVKVNDATWNMVRLDRAGGDIVSGARIELPMGLFKPGHNTIAFQPLLHPADAASCSALRDTPMFTLFDDSRIEVPHFARLARQPDLRLFADRGFPYAVSDSGMMLMVAGGEPAAVTAAWMLRGKLAQRHGAPLQNVIMTSRLSATERHLLVVGPLDALPDGVVAASTMPLRTGGRGAFRRAGAEAPEVEPAESPAPAHTQTAQARDDWAQRLAVNTGADSGNIFDTAADWLISMARAVPDHARPAEPSSEELWALEMSGEAGTMVAFRSPYAPDRTVTVVTAGDAAALQKVAPRLIEDATWAQLEGDVSIWGAGSDQVLSRRVAPPYVIEAVDASVQHVWLLWRTFMAENTSYWLALVFALVVSLTLATGALLRRRATG